MTPPPPSQEQSEALRTETKIQTQVRDPSVSCDEFVGTTPVLGLMVLTTLAQPVATLFTEVGDDTGEVWGGTSGTEVCGPATWSRGDSL